MRAAFPMVLIATVLAGCAHLAESDVPITSPPEPPVAATYRVSSAELPDPLVFIAYGDIRFTDEHETVATNPEVRRALIAKIAAEQPAAIFINGDLPWHGADDDYAAYREESRPWHEMHLRVYPALGNHEFAGCAESECLERWWIAFPELHGRRWYSVALGNQVLGVVLDSDASLLPDSEQRRWLERQLSGLDPRVRMILIVLHHPPVADAQTSKLADHNPRPNEQALADYLGRFAGSTTARVVVSAGHIHNYERFQRDGVVYLVSGGGGASPYEVDRTPQDLYQSSDFPNYHYVRFELRGHTLIGEMIRLKSTAAPEPQRWEKRDRFELTLPP